MLRFRQLSLATTLLSVFAATLYIQIVPWLWPEPNNAFAVTTLLFLPTMITIYFGGMWATAIAFIAVKKEASGTYRYRDHWFGTWTKKHLDHKNFCSLVWGLGILTVVILFLIVMIFAIGIVPVAWSMLKGILFFVALIFVLTGGSYLLDRYRDTLLSLTENRYVSAVLNAAQKLTNKTKTGRQKAGNFMKRKSVCPVLDVH